MHAELNSACIRNRRFHFGLQLKWPSLVNMAQTRSNRPWRRQFRLNNGKFLHEKITLAGIDSILVEYIANFQFTNFLQFLAASNAIVADESGVRR
jgi:hypothetical protein